MFSRLLFIVYINFDQWITLSTDYGVSDSSLIHVMNFFCALTRRILFTFCKLVGIDIQTVQSLPQYFHLKLYVRWHS